MHFTCAFVLAALPFLVLTNPVPYDDDTLSFLAERAADAQSTYKHALYAREASAAGIYGNGLVARNVDIQTSSTDSGTTTIINGVVQPQVPSGSGVNSISTSTINGVTTTTINGVVQPPQGPAKKPDWLKKQNKGKDPKKPNAAWPFDFGVQKTQVTNINTRDTSRLARALYARKLRERAMQQVM